MPRGLLLSAVHDISCSWDSALDHPCKPRHISSFLHSEFGSVQTDQGEAQKPIHPQNGTVLHQASGQDAQDHGLQRARGQQDSADQLYLANSNGQVHEEWKQFLSGPQPHRDGNGLSSDSVTEDHVKASSMGSDHSSHQADANITQGYNPWNRTIFLLAMPITAGLALFFECAKGMIAETDLKAPLPDIVQVAKQEVQASKLSSALRILAPYSHGPTRVKGLCYGVAHVTMMGVLIYVDLVLTQWNGVFWSALQAHQATQFYHLLFDFSIITGVLVLLNTYNDYLTGMWHLHARDHLTRYFNQLWVGNGAMCRMQQSETQVDNPDQRIEEDVDTFVGSSRELFFGALSSSVTLLVYAPMLVSTAPPQLLIFVLVYPMFGAVTTHMLGRQLIPLSAASQCATADFRSELVHARDNAASLALLQAGPQLERSLQSRFEVMKRLVYAVLDTTKVLNLFKTIFSEYGSVVPFVLLAPSYFTGAIDLGTLMQLRIVVSRVSESLSFPITAYEQGIGWRAATNRLAFLQTQAQAFNAGMSPTDDFRYAELRAENVTVKAENNIAVSGFSVRVGHGDNVLVVGEAGSGKSLLVKALAGVWSQTDGLIERPDSCMFIQGFDFPQLTLEGLLSYPEDPVAREEAEAILRAVGATSLLDELGHETVRAWTNLLSREKQERIQLARVLVRRPKFVVLDEPLSALESVDARMLLAHLVASYPSMGVLIFSRDRRLADVRTRVMAISASSDSATSRLADSSSSSAQPRQRGAAQPTAVRGGPRGAARNAAPA